jgi:hypothetical protein
MAFHYSDPTYQDSDQAFVDEWDAAIDMYGEIFPGVTLVLSTGDGLINFHPGGDVPVAFAFDCPTVNMDCAAETTILSHFVDGSVAAHAGKATQESGLTANWPPPAKPVNLGTFSPRTLAQLTESFNSPAAQILAGLQFTTAVSVNPDGEGCPTSSCPPGSISVEQGLYNVLRDYFNTTPAFDAFGGNPGVNPSNYLQVYAADVEYATATAMKIPVTESGGAVEVVSAQDLLNQASQALLGMAERGPVITAVSGPFGGSSPILPNALVAVTGTNLGPVGYALQSSLFSLFGGNPKPIELEGVSITVNGKNGLYTSSARSC